MSIGLLLLVAALRAWVQWVGPLPGDRVVVSHYATPWTNAAVLRCLTAFYSSLGTPLIAAVLICGAMLLIGPLNDRRTAYGLIVACLVIPLNALVKLVSGPTPLWTQAHRSGHNFPSGHVAFVTSVVGYLGWVATRRHQPAAVVAALLVIVGMGPARVVVGVHLVSDVLAGYLVGGSVLVLAIAMANRDPRRAFRNA